MNSVREWTGNQTPACNAATGTTQAESQSWLSMSTVDGVNGTFNFPYTRMTGWLCSSVTSGAMNNSSGQAEQFYQQITDSSQIQSYQLNDVQSCPGAENVSQGTPPQSGFTNNGMGAIEGDMVGTVNAGNQCQRASRPPQ